MWCAIGLEIVESLLLHIFPLWRQYKWSPEFVHLDLCTLTPQAGHCSCETSLDLPQHPTTHGQVSVTCKAPPSSLHRCGGPGGWLTALVYPPLHRHWIAVFSFIVHAKARNSLQQLLLHIKKKEGEDNLTNSTQCFW